MKRQTTLPLTRLKVMYIYTIVLPGLTGLTVIFFPGVLTAMFQIESQDPFFFGVTGSMWLSFAALSVLGLKSPVKYLPLFLFQFSYKVIWLSTVVVPLAVQGHLSLLEWLFAGVMVTYVIGDIMVIPFSKLLSREWE